jgi:hypothetical protein
MAPSPRRFYESGHGADATRELEKRRAGVSTTFTSASPLRN